VKESFVGRREKAIETDIQVGLREIVESIYGGPTPELPGLDVGRSYLGTAHDFIFGGDLVDVFHNSDGCTTLAVVDIKGHGIAAAMHAGLIKHALRAYVSQGSTVLSAVRALNHLCIENSAFDGAEDLFATLFFGMIDRDRRTLTYVSAGHRTAYMIEPFKVTALDACAPIVGLLDDGLEFSSRTIALSAGVIIAIVTDGFTEARNTKGEFLGSKALADIILADPNRSAQISAEAITRRAYDYTQQDNHDDVAALVVKIVNAEPPAHASNGAAYPSSVSRQRPVLDTAAGSNGKATSRGQEVQSETYDSTSPTRIDLVLRLLERRSYAQSHRRCWTRARATGSCSI
jgi:serine phosphatase RsbU (regulator of sigma subunit)